MKLNDTPRFALATLETPVPKEKKPIAASPTVKSASADRFEPQIRCTMEEYDNSDREGYTLKGKGKSFLQKLISLDMTHVGGLGSLMMTGGGLLCAGIGALIPGNLPLVAVGMGMSLLGVGTGTTVARGALYDTP